MTAPTYVQALDAAAPPRADLGVITHRWRYRDLRALSAAAGSLVLVHPGLGAPPRTTRTLTCTVTRLRPGERARTTQRASGVRIVLEGEASFAPTDDTRLTLARGDVVRTQDAGAFDWEAGGDGALWLDAIDLPLVSAISPESLEGAEHARCRRSPRRSRCGHEQRPACLPLPVIHRWARTEAVLAAADGDFPRIARYGTPKAGGDVTAALRAEVQRLPPGLRSPSVRANHSAVIVALAGRGTSVVAGWRVQWEPGDVVVVPPGAAVDHRADVLSDLLVVSDAPAMQALGLWWSETERRPQPIEGPLD